MEIRSSARRHGISDRDIEHAIEHYVYIADRESDVTDGVLYIGPDTAGNLLEIFVLEPPDGSQVVLHAMKMRRRYAELLR